MSLRTKGVAVMIVQLLLVTSIAAKYAWERHTCPRVWTRATQFDPEQPIRGRYIALGLHASACGLSRSDALESANFVLGSSQERVDHALARTWTVVPVARDGKLVGVIADDKRPEVKQQLVLPPYLPCDAAQLSDQTEFFIPEHAKTPFPLANGEELWAEVTVPPAGPPRPVRLAVSDGKNFRVLDLQ